MTTVEIKHLFKFKRFPENELKLLCLVLYLPVGLVLFILRTVFALGAVLVGCSLSDSSIVHKLVNKLACLSLGITVTIEDFDKNENVEVYISNSLSIFDHLAVHTATGSVSPGNQMHSTLAKSLGIHYFGNLSNLEVFKKNVTSFITEAKIPVHFTPEDKITNGRALLKFKTYPFAVSAKVQPVCISIERPYLDLSVTTLGSSYWVDCFCYMFSPSTNYKLKFLPPLEKKSIGDAEFAEIVRQNIAAALTVETPEFSAADLNEWEKRQLIEQQRPQPTPRPATIDGEIRRMATQVKEVLPHVPLNVIHRDLNKTRNVDTTITNLLEGRIQFVPEQLSSPASAGPQPSTSTTESVAYASTAVPNRDLFNTAASSFAKSAQERNKSFQERKDQLIANARKRYIEKHNLNIPF